MMLLGWNIVRRGGQGWIEYDEDVVFMHMFTQGLDEWPARNLADAGMAMRVQRIRGAVLRIWQDYALMYIS